MYVKKPKSILSKTKKYNDTDSELSSEFSKNVSLKVRSEKNKTKIKNYISAKKSKKGCKSEKVVRFHEDLEAEGGDSEL